MEERPGGYRTTMSWRLLEHSWIDPDGTDFPGADPERTGDAQGPQGGHPTDHPDHRRGAASQLLRLRRLRALTRAVGACEELQTGSPVGRCAPAGNHGVLDAARGLALPAHQHPLGAVACYGPATPGSSSSGGIQGRQRGARNAHQRHWTQNPGCGSSPLGSAAGASVRRGGGSCAGAVRPEVPPEGAIPVPPGAASDRTNGSGPGGPRQNHAGGGASCVEDDYGARESH